MGASARRLHLRPTLRQTRSQQPRLRHQRQLQVYLRRHLRQALLQQQPHGRLRLPELLSQLHFAGQGSLQRAPTAVQQPNTSAMFELQLLCKRQRAAQVRALAPRRNHRCRQSGAQGMPETYESSREAREQVAATSMRKERLVTSCIRSEA